MEGKIETRRYCMVGFAGNKDGALGIGNMRIDFTDYPNNRELKSEISRQHPELKDVTIIALTEMTREEADMLWKEN